jgi:hypothetical protein
MWLTILWFLKMISWDCWWYCSGMLGQTVINELLLGGFGVCVCVCVCVKPLAGGYAIHVFRVDFVSFLVINVLQDPYFPDELNFKRGTILDWDYCLILLGWTQ